MLLELKSGCVYGPVRSRRLGASLGINALPPGRKTCSFDCLYCQYGWTPRDTESQAASFPSVEQVLSEVAAALAELVDPPAFLTFSGNGEPTLHPEFPALVEGAIALRDRLARSTRTAILSNSTRVGDPDVQAALRRLDVRIMKLDAASQSTLDAFNQPLWPLAIGELIAGLRALGEVTLQALFASGPAGNLDEEHVTRWLEAVREIRPMSVQVYTLARGFPSRDIEPAPPAALAAIAATLRESGIAATAF
jgi:wyosine [tRNA(Phe)-imidazoG37] synthetase (radical SAM superfamily)